MTNKKIKKKDLPLLSCFVRILKVSRERVPRLLLLYFLEAFYAKQEI